MTLEVAPEWGADAAAAGRFERWYRAHFREVYVQCLRYAAGDAGWAEDVAHDVFVKLLEHQQEIDDARVGAWLYRVAANTAISRVRRRRWWTEWLRGPGAVAPPPLPSPHDLYDARRRGAVAAALLAALPDRERIVLCMKVIDGHAQKDIAEILGCSEGYVSKLVTRALAQVRAAGWEVDDG